MQGTKIEENVNLDYAILDKNVIISNSINLKGTIEWPIIIEKNAKV